MSDISEVFGGNLKCTDLGPLGSKKTVQISGVEPVEFKKKDGSPDPKLRIELVGENKAFICNVTNAKQIAKRYGTDYSAWVGKKIVIEHGLWDVGGEEIPGIKVPKPSSLIQQATAVMKPIAPAESEDPADAMDDGIPF